MDDRNKTVVSNTKTRTQRLLEDIAEGIALASKSAAQLEAHLGGAASADVTNPLDTMYRSLRSLCDSESPSRSARLMGELFEALQAEQLLPCGDCGAESPCTCRAQASYEDEQERLSDADRGC